MAKTRKHTTSQAFNKATLLVFALIAGSFVGWLYEVFICGPLNGEGIDLAHGGLGLPFLQIYGFGALIIQAVFGLSDKKRPWWLLFIATCILTAILEYGAGLIMLNAFGVQTWDYRVPGWDFMRTPDGLLCLRGVLTFGIMGLILLKAFNPWAKRALKRHRFLFALIIWALTALLVAGMLNAYIFHWVYVTPN